MASKVGSDNPLLSQRSENGKNGVPHIPLPVSVQDLGDHHLSPSSTESDKAARPLPPVESLKGHPVSC